jgi:hypothetical protein
MSVKLVNRKKIQLPTEYTNKNICSCDECNTSINLSFGDIRHRVYRLDDNNKVITERICSDCYASYIEELYKPNDLFNYINK